MDSKTEDETKIKILAKNKTLKKKNSSNIHKQVDHFGIQYLLGKIVIESLNQFSINSVNFRILLLILCSKLIV